MADWKPVQKAKKYGFGLAEVQILFWVTGWFNGKSISVHDRPASIADTHEPTLRQLCGDDWRPERDEVHERLIRQGLFKTQERGEDIYIAGRRCRWAPTDRCLEIVQDIFADEEQLYPAWVLDEHTRPPTYRDGSELMEHRKGVLAAKRLFGNLERVDGVDTYPRVDLPQRPDLRLWARDGSQLARVEVLTDHNNRESWANKFEAWAGKTAGPTIWIFENRQHMIDVWNYFVRRGLELDGGRFGGEANNWSPQRVNDRLRRSRQGRPNYNSHDAVWTIPGVVGADRVDAFNLFKSNNIILNS